ncbi:serine protease [Streptomyces sp. NPDC004327]|uniref:serine protease n=1 Tax=Streptomyces sp. NPDC004327 TaxID=3364699 RepID=UPI0036D0C026
MAWSWRRTSWRGLAGVTLVGTLLGLLSSTVPAHAIVNGTKATRMPPYMASLQEYRRHICGGVILDDRTILTAAHCLQRQSPPSALSVGVGSLRLDGTTNYPVEKYVVHPQYSMFVEYNNDVAVLKLATPLTFKPGSVGPVSWPPSSGQPPYGQILSIAGWGLLSEGGSAPNDLYTTNVMVLRNDEEGCSNYSREGRLSDTMFCAGYPDGHTDACQGDSGGALVNRYNELVGIASWGQGCALPGRAGVYTNVNKLYSWIKANM